VLNFVNFIVGDELLCRFSLKLNGNYVDNLQLTSSHTCLWLMLCCCWTPRQTVAYITHALVMPLLPRFVTAPAILPKLNTFVC